MAAILIVEDNVNLALGLRITLEREGHRLIVVHTGSDALDTIKRESVDLVVLDLVLPDMSGFDVIREARCTLTASPILVVSALTDETDRVAAFRLGADDYVTKPFSLLEFIERVKARLRSSLAPVEPLGIRIDSVRYEVTYGDVRIRLTPREFDLLSALAATPGAVLSRDQLLQQVWKAPPGLRTRTVEYHVASLRRKLKEVGLSNVIQNVHGRGFFLVADSHEPQSTFRPHAPQQAEPERAHTTQTAECVELSHTDSR